jgi:hypothetical protein
VALEAAKGPAGRKGALLAAQGRRRDGRQHGAEQVGGVELERLIRTIGQLAEDRAHREAGLERQAEHANVRGVFRDVLRIEAIGVAQNERRPGGAQRLDHAAVACARMKLRG